MVETQEEEKRNPLRLAKDGEATCLDEKELENCGWVKVHKDVGSNEPAYSQYRASEKQLEWLQNHLVHYSKFACMQ